MQRRTKWIAGGAVVLAAVGGGAGIAVANGGDEDQPLTGTELDRAVVAAMAETGGGTVIDSEVGDDGAGYAVEIRLEDGSQVEVNLDGNFRVLGVESDDDTAGEASGSGDD